MDKYLGSFLRTFNPFGPFLRAIQQLSGQTDISLFDDFKNIGGFLTQKLGNQVGDTLVDTAGSYIGANMAPKDIQAAELQLQNQRTLRQTEFLDAVSSMKNAGINPALMYGSGANTSAGSAQVSNTAGSLSDLIALATLPAQLKLLKAQTNKTDADANKAVSETKGQDISNEFAAALNQSALDSQKASRELTRAQYREVEQAIDNMTVQKLKISAEVAELDSRVATQATERLLNRATANRLVQLLPYEQLELQARTEAEKNAAAYSAAQAAWQNGLIDHNYVELTCRALEIQNSIGEIEAQLTNPEFDGANDDGFTKFARYMVAVMRAMLSPLKGIVSIH